MQWLPGQKKMQVMSRLLPQIEIYICSSLLKKWGMKQHSTPNIVMMQEQNPCHLYFMTRSRGSIILYRFLKSECTNGYTALQSKTVIATHELPSSQFMRKSGTSDDSWLFFLYPRHSHFIRCAFQHSSDTLLSTHPEMQCHLSFRSLNAWKHPLSNEPHRVCCWRLLNFCHSFKFLNTVLFCIPMVYLQYFVRIFKIW